jgi:uncharacterized protein YwqG
MKELNEKQLQVIEQFKKKNKKECYEIKVDENTDISPINSSIGGIPYMSEYEDYPINKKGEKMPLFIQINLDGIMLENYPNKGIFQIFLENEAGYPTEYKVKYYAEVSLNYKKDIEDIKNNWVAKPFSVKLEKSENIMSVYDAEFDNYFIPIYNEIMETNFTKQAEIIDYDDIVEKMYASQLNANFGGYADSTQGENFHYEKNDVLLKIDSNLSKDLYIGDAGIVWALINKEDLKSGQLENAFVDWDCC